MPVPGTIGLAFGGPKHDILYVLASSNVFDFTIGQSALQVPQGTSLYAMKGLGVRSFSPFRLNA